MQKVEIRIDGFLDKNWVEWLDGFEINHIDPNETVLLGMVKDQAALYGIVAKLRDLGLKLISMNIREARTK